MGCIECARPPWGAHEDSGCVFGLKGVNPGSDWFYAHSEVYENQQLLIERQISCVKSCTRAALRNCWTFGVLLCWRVWCCVSLVVFQLGAETPKLAEYQAYIDFEMKAGDPARIQLIYERALAENCLVPDLWARYNQYLVRKKSQECLQIRVPVFTFVYF